jgi:hypothetical protein
MGKSEVQELEALEPYFRLFLKQRQLPPPFGRDEGSPEGQVFQE